MLDWWNTAPKAEEVWHGLKFFQWVRIGLFLQAFGGSFVLADLVSPRFKKFLSNKADQIKQPFAMAAAGLKEGLTAHEPDKPKSKLRVWLFRLAFYLLGAGTTAFVAYHFEYQDRTGWHHLSIERIIILSLVLGIPVGWLASLALALTVGLALVAVVALVGAPLSVAWFVGWSLNFERFKGSMIMVGFLFLLVGTVLTIAFS